jgi:hypothetical protein
MDPAGQRIGDGMEAPRVARGARGVLIGTCAGCGEVFPVFEEKAPPARCRLCLRKVRDARNARRYRERLRRDRGRPSVEQSEG